MAVKGKYKTLYIFLFVIYMATVAVLCFLRPESLPEVDKDTFLGIPIDKILHFLMFVPFPVLAGMVFIKRDGRTAANIATMLILAVAGAGIAYGTEVLQSHTEYRSYEIADFYADLVGISAGTIAALTYIIHTGTRK